MQRYFWRGLHWELGTVLSLDWSTTFGKPTYFVEFADGAKLWTFLVGNS
jgi:hypothetical protein